MTDGATGARHGGRIRRRVVLGALSAFGALACLAVLVHAAQPESGPGWRQAGLSGVTVHDFASGHSRGAPVFAATEQGVYRLVGTVTWRRVLDLRSVWSVSMASDNRTVASGDNLGNVAVSVDAGLHWRRTLVSSTGVYAVSLRPGQTRTLIAGTGDGIYVSHDGGTTWARRLRLVHMGVDAIAWQPGSARLVFAATVADSETARTGVFVSRDAGATWHSYGKGLDRAGGVMSLAIGVGRGPLAGTMGHAVWSSTGPHGTWQETAAGMPATGDHVAQILSVPGRTRTLMAATLGKGVFRSTDEGRHWIGDSNGLQGDALIVLSLAAVPARHVILAGTAVGVYALGVAAH